jgi:hypothetical protein
LRAVYQRRLESRNLRRDACIKGEEKERKREKERKGG